ncbi:MAG: hypothetical protein ACYDG2_15130, partial [Ruminiclostridium sp.]
MLECLDAYIIIKAFLRKIKTFDRQFPLTSVLQNFHHWVLNKHRVENVFLNFISQLLLCLFFYVYLL